MREKITVSPKAKYIWTAENKTPDNYVIFRKHLTVEKIPKTAKTLISVDTKYWLYVNGQEVVFEGGLFRESLPGCGYADNVDIAPYIKTGENIIAVLAHFFGNQGRNNVNSGQAGFLFSCDALDIQSNQSFLCKKHEGFYHVEDSRSSHLFGGHDLGIIAASEDHRFSDVDFTETGFNPATEYENEVWGELCIRPVPLIKRTKTMLFDFERQNNSIKVNFPYAMAFSPYIKLNAAGDETLIIKSDRYEVPGGPGDGHNKYRAHLIEYRCKEGLNEFLTHTYFFGESFTIESKTENLDSIQIIAAGAAESKYDTEDTAFFKSSCPVTNRLVEKSLRTLKVCMRDNFMDCPDRERGQWIGDVSVQASQALMVLDENAAKLVGKAILDFILLRKGDVLVGNVPGSNFSELPGQSLNAIGGFGLIAEYVKYTGDTDILKLTFEPSVRYLMLWETDDEGMLIPRKGNWYWFDHLYNKDDTVLEHAFYYSALKFAEKTAALIGNTNYDAFLETRIALIEENFNQKFWNGRCYSSGTVTDDRANAIAVLAGLADQGKYIKIKDVLLTVFNSSIYMENYVLWALCKMGYVKDAYLRMISRYYTQSISENSTLWEDFYLLGTKNHAWSGAPLSIAFKYFAGIDTEDGFESYTVNPATDIFPDMSFSFCTKTKKVLVTVVNKKITIQEINL